MPPDWSSPGLQGPTEEAACGNGATPREITGKREALEESHGKWVSRWLLEKAGSEEPIAPPCILTKNGPALCTLQPGLTGRMNGVPEGEDELRRLISPSVFPEAQCQSVC